MLGGGAGGEGAMSSLASFIWGGRAQRWRHTCLHQLAATQTEQHREIMAAQRLAVVGAAVDVGKQLDLRISCPSQK